jgi:hypothetical protein
MDAIQQQKNPASCLAEVHIVHRPLSKPAKTDSRKEVGSSLLLRMHFHWFSNDELARLQ